MKTRILTILLLGVTVSMYAQEVLEDKLPNNELKLNLLYTLAGFPELSYDRIINNNTSVGLSVGFQVDEDIWDFDYTITSNYRVYFGKKRAAGFFIEMNASLVNEYSRKSLGLGVATGVKLLNKSGWTAEVYVGLIRDMLNNISVEAYPRTGISIGKRF